MTPSPARPADDDTERTEMSDQTTTASAAPADVLARFREAAEDAVQRIHGAMAYMRTYMEPAAVQEQITKAFAPLAAELSAALARAGRAEAELNAASGEWSDHGLWEADCRQPLYARINDSLNELKGWRHSYASAMVALETLLPDAKAMPDLDPSDPRSDAVNMLKYDTRYPTDEDRASRPAPATEAANPAQADTGVATDEGK